MNYEEKYKEIVGKIRKAYLYAQTDSTKAVLEEIILELAESEDEKIRKEIKQLIQDLKCADHRKKRWISWLERQGEHANFRYKIQVGDKVTRNEAGVLVNLSQLERAAKSKEKKIVQKVNYTTIAKTGDGGINALVTGELPTDSEQKTTDKVKPKFHEGEWITNGDYIWKILEVKPLDYTLQSQDDNIVVDTISHVDEQFHSFTIADAKHGDVLVNWNNTIFIFNAIEDETVKFHIAYNEKWDAIKTPSTKLSLLRFPEPQFEFHPATKEQRDTLLKSIANAGYTFDFESKELLAKA